MKKPDIGCFICEETTFDGVLTRSVQLSPLIRFSEWEAYKLLTDFGYMYGHIGHEWRIIKWYSIINGRTVPLSEMFATKKPVRLGQIWRDCNRWYTHQLRLIRVISLEGEYAFCINCDWNGRLLNDRIHRIHISRMKPANMGYIYEKTVCLRAAAKPEKIQ